MNEPTFPLINKNKVARAESGRVLREEQVQQQTQSNHLLDGVFGIVKKYEDVSPKLQKDKYRNAFRQIFEHARNDKIQKNVTNFFASTQKQKTQGGKLKATLQQHNPEKKPRQIENLCFKKTVLTLKNVVSILDKNAKNTLRMSWIKLQCVGMQTATQDYHNQISSEGQNLNKNVSKLSNKRKVTRGRQEYKQNSHLSATEIIAQNQRLKNEMINEQYEREAFVEQLGELLQKHEKSLAQGYSTTRTHKKNK